MRILPEHNDHQGNSQDPTVPEKLNSQFLSPVLSHVPSINSSFLCALQDGRTTAPWFETFHMWNKRWSICFGNARIETHSLGRPEGVRRLRGNWPEGWQGAGMRPECPRQATVTHVDWRYPLQLCWQCYSFDSQGFPVALCICSLKVIWLPILLNWFSREWKPSQPLHVDFPTPPPKYIYLWVANWLMKLFAFCTFEIFFFLYIVFAARPVELIHWI